MGPGGPGPWNSYPYPPGPGGPPGAPGLGQVGRQSANHTPNNQTPTPAPIGPAADRKLATPAQPPVPQPEVSTEPKHQGQPSKQPAATSAAPPPVEPKSTVEEVKPTSASLAGSTPIPSQNATKPIPTGPKIGRPTQILPAVPLPAALTTRTPQQNQASSSSKLPSEPNNAAVSTATLRDATEAAKAAVAVAMAEMGRSTAGQQQANGGSVDNLTKKVNEMRVNAARSGQQPSRGSSRGRGGGPRPAKVDVPDSDFDFASANAKFNKQDVVKEAIAGSPLTETPNGGASTPEVAPDAAPGAPAYNKSKSFFDNISSEAKDRLENGGQKPGGREWRGEEQRKNMETFGQGSVDGGFRGYRGRGRGRGGRGRGYRGGRGSNAGGFRPREGQSATP